MTVVNDYKTVVFVIKSLFLFTCSFMYRGIQIKYQTNAS